MTTGGPHDWPISPPSPLATFHGFGRLQQNANGGVYRHVDAPITIPNTGAPGAVSVLGPPAGVIRFFANFAVCTAGAAAATIQVELVRPALPNLMLQRATALASTTGSSAALAFSFQCLALGAGESILWTNTGAGDAVLWYSYIDVPAIELNLVRFVLSGSPSEGEVIPIAPAGFQHHLVTLWTHGTTSQGRPVWTGFNDDTVTHQLRVFLGINFIARGPGVNANNVITLPSAGGDLVVTDEPLRYALDAAPTTRGATITLCYEVLPR